MCRWRCTLSPPRPHNGPQISDPDTAVSDVKVTVTTSNSKFMPVSSIKIGKPTADGTLVFSVTPVLKEKVRGAAAGAVECLPWVA